MEEEVDEIFYKLKKKHKDCLSGPELHLWAWMIAAGTHDDMENPTNVSMIVGGLQQQP